MHDGTTIESLLNFWFAPGDQLRRWFGVDATFDDECRRRFLAETEAALVGERIEWATTPEGCLALVLLVDQMTRNLFRGEARAFAGDALAASVAASCIERGDDARLPWMRRAFLYLPLEHAESAAVQAKSVACFQKLKSEAPASERATADRFVDAALQHQRVIERFGRFPARNRALGRANTKEEAAFLAQRPAGL